ncbi:hypothetical protein AJ80_08163 [Polytolypa hystricis UAMH7299]|uniref:Uncharacterized protein n=1 Tax=Polytolypa hystricis (strain UAMH7299) TaxID=1447883 RepID=A0A2B7XC44_POLH7|nr:hypothetical protein AJ80_08163 [Polytolypa hystricis UAMH7299]
MPSAALVYSVGILLLTSILVETVINGVFAATFNHVVPGIGLVAFVGVILSALNSFVLGFLILLLATNSERNPRNRKSWEKRVLMALSACLSSAVIVLIIILRGYGNGRGERGWIYEDRPRILYYAWCGLCGLSIILQIVFFCMIGWPNKNARKTDSVCYLDSRSPSPVTSLRLSRLKKPSITTMSVKSTPDRPLFPTTQPVRRSPEMAGTKRQPNTPWPGQHELNRPPHPPYANFRRTSNASQEHTFEQWDTSSVPPEIHDVVMRSHLPRSPPTAKINWDQRLPSPRTRLEGPMLPASPSRNPPSPAYLSQSGSPSLKPPSPAYIAQSPPLQLRRRSRSLEDHIHPLFRSDRPNSPPRTSPLTKLTVFSSTEPTISVNAVRRMRSATLTSPISPSPLTFIESLHAVEKKEFGELPPLPLTPRSPNVGASPKIPQWEKTEKH